jgi:hypothetical protein
MRESPVLLQYPDSDAPATTVDDLAGYWALVERECRDVDTCFHRAHTRDQTTPIIETTRSPNRPVVKASPPTPPNDVDAMRDMQRRNQLAQLKRQARQRLREQQGAGTDIVQTRGAGGDVVPAL